MFRGRHKLITNQYTKRESLCKQIAKTNAISGAYINISHSAPAIQRRDEIRSFFFVEDFFGIYSKNINRESCNIPDRTK